MEPIYSQKDGLNWSLFLIQVFIASTLTHTFKKISDNSILYKRLEDRNYSASKIQENVECEIMRMIAEEARQGYKEDVVVYLESNTVEDMENNSENIINWIKQHS